MRQDFGDKLDFPKEDLDIDAESSIDKEKERRIAIWVNQVETDALLAILLNAPENPHISPIIAEKLLYLVADTEREFGHPETKANAKCLGRRKRVMRARSRRIVQLRPEAFDTIFSVR